MEIIAHRINRKVQLAELDRRYGVEVDIRSRGEDLIIHHDPFSSGENFEDWLSSYAHGTLILNVKEEGLEERLIALMAARQIESFFFLDQSFPFLVKWSARGESRAAVRVSEYENIETAISLAGRVQWVWVDCFSRFPLERNSAELLKNAGFKLCLVSPELQGREAAEEIPELINLLKRERIRADAVCTKRLDLWNYFAQ